MKTIDADAHILEGEHTWDFLQPHEQKFRPAVVEMPEVPDRVGRGTNGRERYWSTLSINGWPEVMTTRLSLGDQTIPESARDLTDVPARLALMDELGVDKQVIYPTLFLVRPTDHPELMVALTRSYNRFMAEAFGNSKGRLPWVLVPAVESMAESLAELEFGKMHGACGVLLSGIEGQHVLSDPYFYPLFEKASALNLPICVHAGIGSRLIRLNCRSRFVSAISAVMTAFHDVLLGGTCDRFPKLRFGFIETGAQWIPYLIQQVGLWKGWMSKNAEGEEGNIMRDNRLFVSCRMDDDIPYLLRWAGKGNLVTGTDYGHDDFSKDIFAFQKLRGGALDAETVDGIVCNNASTLYGI
jgi:predicted TIM-barrel fold metal-dependent hydrolase